MQNPHKDLGIKDLIQPYGMKKGSSRHTFEHIGWSQLDLDMKEKKTKSNQTDIKKKKLKQNQNTSNSNGVLLVRKS